MSSGASTRSAAGGRGGVNVKSETVGGVHVKLEDGESASNSQTPGNSGTPAGSSTNGRAKKEASPPPPTTYRDIALKSSTLDDWRYHLMRFASHAVVNPGSAQQFPFPVKLNRKWPPKLKDPLPRAGDPVVDQFGKPILVPAQRREPGQASQTPQVPLTAAERKRIPLLWPGPDDDVDEVEELVARLDQPKGPQADASLIGPSSSSNNATRAKAGLFQKRVREIHKASAAARRTHNEEALPWILEDYETSKDWESRRKESRRGLKALQLGIKTRRDGGSFPSLPKADEDTLRAEAIAKEEESKPDVKAANDNHAPWIGKLEGEAHESGSTSAGGAMSHALFVFDEREAGSFRLVPVTRMYKFLQRPKHANKMSWEEAEKVFEQHQKARLGEASKWTVSNEHSGPAGRRGGGRASGVKSEGGGNAGIFARLQLPASSKPDVPSAETIYNRDAYQRRNQFVAVSGESKRGVRVKDEEGTYGEIDFEEDFADDEERHEGDDFALNEEEAKELEQKIKREMARAEEERDDEDDVDDLFDDHGRPGRGENDVLTGSGQQMKKIMKALARREGNDVYDDDDEDRNPYLSDESDGGEDSVMANPEEALRRVREEREREAKEAAKNNGGSQSATNGASAVPSKSPSKAGSRSGTPAPRSTAEQGRSNNVAGSSGSAPRQLGNAHRPGAGHANVAQRATSPSAMSRQGSRSGSPVHDTASGSGNAANLKRKSEIGTPSGHKRLRTGTSGSASQPGSPGSASPRSGSPSRGSFRTNSGSQAVVSEFERDIVQLVRQGKAKTTKELISHFSARFKGPEMAQRKKAFSEAASRVLTTKKPEGTLDIRPGF